MDNLNPDGLSLSEVRAHRLAKENADFNLEYYAYHASLLIVTQFRSEFVDPPEELPAILSFVTRWHMALHPGNTVERLPSSPSPAAIRTSPSSPPSSSFRHVALARGLLPSKHSSDFSFNQTFDAAKDNLSHPSDSLLLPSGSLPISKKPLIEVVAPDDVTAASTANTLTIPALSNDDMPPLEDGGSPFTSQNTNSDPSKEIVGKSNRDQNPPDASPSSKMINRPPSTNSVTNPYLEQVVDEKTTQFSIDDREALLRLPRRERAFERFFWDLLAADLITNRAVTLSSLVDIVFCYAYDYRVTLGESTVESAWTIVKLSPTLSWLEVRVLFR